MDGALDFLGCYITSPSLAGLPLTNSHNVRSAQLNFSIPHAGVLHGLAGYFEAVLYRDVGLSIHPDRKDRISPNMLSWFPLFFPLKVGMVAILLPTTTNYCHQEPLFLPRSSELCVSIWRMTDKRKVWYEWSAESFLAMPRIQPGDLSSSAVQSSNGVPSGGEGMRSHLLSPHAQSPALSASSPMLDAPQPLWDRGISVVMDESPDLMKIGQTSLHNPGGRSSWIGL